MIKKKIKRAFRLLLLTAIIILSCSFFLSLNGVETDCEYVYRKDFILAERELSFAVYSYDAGEVISYGLTVARKENLNGLVRVIPSIPVFSGESAVVEFGFVKALVLFLLIVLFVSSFIKQRRKTYEEEEEEEEEPEEETIEEAKEDGGCPNCGERIFEGNEYCENCGINIETFKRKQKIKK